MEVRRMRPDELEAMCALSVAAFGDDERIRRLIDALHASWAWDDDLAFVAERDGELVGQVLYTHAILDAPVRQVDVLVLSPIGVRPDLQLAGIGSAMIRTTLSILADRTEPLVFLEGSPVYYPRFGFVEAGPLGFGRPSTRIPPVAFQVHPLPAHEPWMTGTLVYPDAFWRTDCVGVR
jgi:putative acetyltransferase